MAVLCLAGLAVNGLTLGPAIRDHTPQGRTDFMGLYAGGKLAFTADLYKPDRVLETEAATEGMSSPTRLYLRLPCFALLYRPLTLLPYKTASLIWEILCGAAMVGFVLVWPATRRWETAAACCWSLPAWMAWAEGQDLALVLLGIAISSSLSKRGRVTAAGFIASICMVKFHLFLLVPLWIVTRKQWQFARGLIAGAACVTALSFAVGGWGWPVRYFELIRQPSNNPYLDAMINLNALFAGSSHPEVGEAAAVVTLLLAVWLAVRHSPEWGLAAALAAGILITPHAYLADGALLLPAILLVPGVSFAMRIPQIFLLTPIPWLMMLGGLGLIARLSLFAFVLTLGAGALLRIVNLSARNAGRDALPG